MYGNDLNEEKNVTYYENKYEIVSRVAFLCGVDEKFFADGSNFLPQIYEILKKDSRASVIRNLCLLRNAIEHHFKKINQALFYEGRSFFGLSELVPVNALTAVSLSGVRLPTSSRQVTDILCEINRAIGDRINNCRDLVPDWINWEYIRDLFIMPNGLKNGGLVEAANLFYENLSCYPYGVYINWSPVEIGNLFANDYKFATTMYGWHGQKFLDTSNLSDVSMDVKNRIYDYLDGGEDTILIVDCENADPYSLCAMFNSLSDEQTDKLSRIILFDDPQAPSGWKFFEKHAHVDQTKFEHIIINRILDNKSLLDVKLSSRVTKEFYQNRISSFILVSSDSDFWGLIEEIPQARFLVMVEHRKTSDELRRVLDENDIFYCFTDDFYTGMDDSLKKKAMFSEFSSYFESMRFNVRDLFEEVLTRTRIEMPDGEKNQFYDKYLRSLKAFVDKDGNAVIRLNN